MNCQTAYYEANEPKILAWRHRIVRAGASAAEAEGRCAWYDGTCPEPVIDGKFCRTHHRIDMTRRNSK
jgi:hypothetical protein